MDENTSMPKELAIDKRGIAVRFGSAAENNNNSLYVNNVEDMALSDKTEDEKLSSGKI